MDMKLVRTTLTNSSTIGELFIDGERECFTLEDAVRPLKIPGVTAIPAGVYEVVVTFSARFKRPLPLPLLLNVPNFDGVRIHTGNDAENTEGCILVGETKSADFIGKSKDAFAALFPKIQSAAQSEKIILEITDPA